MNKKICVMGTKQSGSTRLFNLVRLIYIKNGKTVYSRWNIDFKEIEEKSREYDIILCKIHDTEMNYLNNFDIKLLPLRNILDSALSAGVRWNNTTTKFYIERCNKNIKLFNKFKLKADFIFKYENYNVYYIKELCKILNVSLNNNDIIEIMRELEYMHNSKDLVEKDDHNDKNYQKTLLSRDHNTSNGKINKFTKLSNEQLNDILKEEKIYCFLEQHLYF